MWVPCKCTVIRNNSQFWREHQSLSHSKSYFWEKDCIQFTLKLHTRCSTVWVVVVVVVVVVVTSALALIALETACFPNSVRWRRPLLWVSPIQTPSLQSTCRWCAWWLYASNGRDVTWTAWKIWCPVVMVFLSQVQSHWVCCSMSAHEPSQSSHSTNRKRPAMTTGSMQVACQERATVCIMYFALQLLQEATGTWWF